MSNNGFSNNKDVIENNVTTGNNGTETLPVIQECGPEPECLPESLIPDCEQIYGVGWTTPAGSQKPLCSMDCKLNDNCELSTPFAQVSAGGLHSCGLRTDGSVFCWGANDGQLDVPEGIKFSQIAAGGWHTCGIVDGGQRVICWGNTNTAAGIIASHQANDGTSFTEIRSDYQHSCALDSERKVHCWGKVAYFGSVAGAEDVEEIALGRFHSCVRRGGDTTCEGDSDASESHGNPRNAGGSVGKLGGGGDRFACGLLPNGKAVGWGDNGQIFAGATAVFDDIDAGRHGACATKGTKTKCWGEVNNGDTPHGVAIKSISVGDFHACGILDGTPLCWPASDIDSMPQRFDVNRGQAEYVPEFPEFE